jgi:hypothetical protein
MAPVRAANQHVHCDCPAFHKGSVSVRTRTRHRLAAGIIDRPDETLIPHRQGLIQHGIIPNDDLQPGSGFEQPEITMPSVSEEPELDDTLDFQDVFMNVDARYDGDFSGHESTQNTHEEEAESQESEEEDTDDDFRGLYIDSCDESTFEDGSDGEEDLASDDSLSEDTDDDSLDGLMGGETGDIRLLLQHLKELSGTHQL